MLVAGGFGLLYFGVFDCCLLCRRFWCLGCNGLCFGFIVFFGCFGLFVACCGFVRCGLALSCLYDFFVVLVLRLFP